MAASTARTTDRRAWPGRPAGPVAILAAALLPVAVLGLLLAGLWSPQDRLGSVRAAIVSHDEPVEVEGETLPLGRELAAGLVDGEGAETNYAWEVTDSRRAADGLADGTYGAVVTIPEDFSAAATSITDEDGEPRQALVDVTTPAGGRVLDDALARIVATTAAGVLGDTVTETYVDNLLLGFDTLGSELGEAAEGAEALADGAEEASGGAADLAEGAEGLAEGAGQASTGAAELAGGAAALSGGAAELTGGAGELAGGAAELAGGIERSAGGARELSGGAAELSGGAGELAGGATDLAAGMRALDEDVAELPGAATELAGGAREVADGLEQYVEAVFAIREAVGCPPDGSGTDPLCRALEEAVGPLVELQEGADQVAEGMADFAGDPSAPSGLYALSEGVTELSAATGEVAGGAAEVAGGAQELSGGAAELAGGLEELAGGAGALSGAADALGSGAGELAEGGAEVAAGADHLAAGTGELAEGNAALAEGGAELAGGVAALADGAGELADGLAKATEEIPSHGESERQRLAGVAAEPVAGPGMDDLGAGSSGPLFVVIALWLGALVLMLVLPALPPGTFGSTRAAPRLILDALALPAVVGALSGAAAGAILAGVEGLGPGGWIAAVTLGAAISVCFVAVNQALAAGLGHAGRAASILVAIVALATSVVATAPGWLMTARDVLPVGPALDALLAVVAGAGGLLVALVLLVAWTAAAVGLSALAASRRRTLRVRQLLAA